MNLILISILVLLLITLIVVLLIHKSSNKKLQDLFSLNNSLTKSVQEYKDKYLRAKLEVMEKDTLIEHPELKDSDKVIQPTKLTPEEEQELNQFKNNSGKK